MGYTVVGIDAAIEREVHKRKSSVDDSASRRHSREPDSNGGCFEVNAKCIA
jgi:hypothetical protein